MKRMAEKIKADIIVVGAGHAGCEAAFAAARMGCDVMLITSQPCDVKNFDSAFVENLGPFITTTVPVS